MWSIVESYHPLIVDAIQQVKNKNIKQTAKRRYNMVKYSICYSVCTDLFSGSIDEESCEGCDSMDVCISLHPELGEVLFKDGNPENEMRELGREDIIYLLENFPSVFAEESHRVELLKAMKSESSEGTAKPVRSPCES